uniref:Aspartate/glutamate/uridylate kinase domain-containing protein n=1 Tax=Aegilops tauschii subsp. strangulata TaxID=200361 RepID=A0A453NX83_AEGTS
ESGCKWDCPWSYIASRPPPWRCASAACVRLPSRGRGAELRGRPAGGPRLHPAVQEQDGVGEVRRRGHEVAGAAGVHDPQPCPPLLRRHAPVLVHGGGPEINSWLQHIGVEPQFRKMVLVSKVNINKSSSSPSALARPLWQGRTPPHRAPLPRRRSPRVRRRGDACTPLRAPPDHRVRPHPSHHHRGRRRDWVGLQHQR